MSETATAEANLMGAGVAHTTSGTAAPQANSAASVIAATMVGTAIEFYDNYCYSIASASYFGLIFFTDVAKSNPVLATIMAFATFAVSFITRPVGSLLFGHFGDRIGRKKSLVVALLMMGVATFIVGVLPGYATLGPWAVVLLCLCRAFQGIGIAGEWSGAALVATENAPAGKRALWGSFPNLGAPIGFFIAYGINLLLTTVLGHDAMVAWGWRVPFLVSAVLVVIGLVIRAHMSETPVFQKALQEDRVVRAPLLELTKHWRQVLLGTCAMGVTYTLFYLLGTWSLSYGVTGMGFEQTEYLAMQMVSIFFFAGFIVYSSVKADQLGRRVVLLVATAASLLLAFALPFMLGTPRSFTGAMLFLCVGFAVMGGLYGPCGSYLPELFPANVRYSGSGLAYNLGAIFGGAFAPSIAAALVASYGIQAVGWYLAVMAVVSLGALFLIRESKDVDFNA